MRIRQERDAPEPAGLPVALAERLSPDHASRVRYVFESEDGWIVLSNYGEFGGGMEWFARAGGEPRAMVIGPSNDDGSTPQNVNRALAIGGVLYVLQGISHGEISVGQLAKVWREHDHFTSHVIARYTSSEPVDWLRDSDGAWLVATWKAIWRVTENGQLSLVARIPEIVDYPDSLARTPDGTLYVGARAGVLRLTPAWADEPRYVADFLIPAGGERDCRPGTAE